MNGMISDRHHKTLRRLLQKKFRRESRRYLIEGVRLCEEALAAGVRLREAVVGPGPEADDRRSRLVRRLSEQNIPVHQASTARFRALSDTESPQGLLAVAEQPDPVSWEKALRPGPPLLVLDRIADPGNLGAILRSAAWFGIEHVLLGRDCAELYNPKTVRSSMGGLFHLRVYDEVDLVQALTAARGQGWRLIAAYPQQGEPLQQTAGGERDLLLIGSEAHGLDPALAPLVDLGITIPARGRGESLNAAVAAGILLYHFCRNR